MAIRKPIKKFAEDKTLQSLPFTPASPSDLGKKTNGSGNQSSNLQSIPGVTPAIPKKPETVKPKSGNEFIRNREKIESRLAEEEGRGGGTPSKRSKVQATKEASIIDQQKAGEITVEEANRQLESIQQGVGGLTNTLGADTTPTRAEERGQALESVGQTVLALVPLILSRGKSAGVTGSTALAGSLTTFVAAAGIENDRQKVRVAAEAFSLSTQNVNDIMSLARSGQIPPEVAIIEIQRNFETINKSERALKILMSDPITKSKSGASDELQTITLYKENYLTIQTQLQNALLEGASLRLNAGTSKPTT